MNILNYDTYITSIISYTMSINTIYMTVYKILLSLIKYVLLELIIFKNGEGK